MLAINIMERIFAAVTEVYMDLEDKARGLTINVDKASVLTQTRSTRVSR